MKKLKGFTLAEVLITLTVIGVVAAITLPPLIQNYQKQVLVNQLKKEYSVVSQAFQKMMADEGVDNIHYIFINKNNDEKSEIYKKYFKNSSIEYVTSGSNIKYKPFIEGTSTMNNFPGFAHIIMLSDGAILYFTGGGVYIDVNGAKGPNQESRDLFNFVIEDNGSVRPFSGKVFEYSTGQGIEVNIPGAAEIMRDGWKMNY